MEDFISASQVRWMKLDSGSYKVTFFHQSQNKEVMYYSGSRPAELTIHLTSILQIPVSVQYKLKAWDDFVIDEIVKKCVGSQLEFCITLFNDTKMIALSMLPNGKIIHRNIKKFHR